MILKQYFLGCLAHASYLIADERTKVAAIVDPQRDIDQYLQDAAALGLRIQHVFLTHFHADFLAGHIELRNRTGARIYLGARAEAEYEFVPLSEGDAVPLGDVRLVALETPGHTPEGVSLLVYDDASGGSDPYAVLTGDTLFIGDVGRPDLLASIGVTADELADMLYDSVRKLAALPDGTLVYPAHGAGSLCGKQLSHETVSTIGEQKRFNYALQAATREEFKALVTAEQPDAPEYFAYDAVLNRQERADLETALRASLRPLGPEELLHAQDEGAQVLDVREAIEFEAAHLRGSLNIGLRGKYATWCGSLLRREAPILLVAEPGQEAEAAMRLGRIGFDNVAGFLDGGMRAVAARPELVGRISRITAKALAERLASPEPPLVIDVRAPGEWSAGHVRGSVSLPLSQLREAAADLPRDRDLVVHCESGYRSAIAASLLARQGFTRLFDLSGGFKAWVAAGEATLTG